MNMRRIGGWGWQADHTEKVEQNTKAARRSPTLQTRVAYSDESRRYWPQSAADEVRVYQSTMQHDSGGD